MRNDIHFWIATGARGILALIIGSAVLIFPDMANTLLLLPFAIAISILCLAAYGVLDSAIIFITSFMTNSRALTIQCREIGAGFRSNCLGPGGHIHYPKSSDSEEAATFPPWSLRYLS